MDPGYLAALNIVFVFILVFANAFFVVSEFSLVKIRKTRLEELANAGNRRAKLALHMHEHLDSYLSAIQLGITLASLGLGWIGEPAISRLLERWFEPLFSDNSVLLHTVSFGIAFGFITLIHVVIGELIPKSLAIQKTEYFSLWVAYPLYWFSKLLYPLIFIFDRLAAKSLRLMGVEPAGEKDLAHSEEELKMIVAASHKGGVIDQTESDIIKNAVDFSEITVVEIMHPRQDMQCLFVADSYEETMEYVSKTCHTRYPLCDKDKDNVIGMLHLRDLFIGKKAKEEGLTAIAREIIFVPENMSISLLLHRMMRKHIHMAIVVDEYGGTAGLISMEDILEELVGEIMDEHDEIPEEAVKKINDDVYEFDGLILLDEAYHRMKLPFAEEKHEENTIGGYVFGLLTRSPKVGDIVEDEYCIFEVLNVKRLRVSRLKATIKPREDQPPE